MHSLKNTIVAVGLLGLSFLFYQASSTNHSEQTELIPALEISDGSENSETQAANSEQNEYDTASKLELPELPKPGPKVSGPSGARFAAPNQTPDTFPSKIDGPGVAVNPFPGASTENGKSAKSESDFPQLPGNGSISSEAKTPTLTPPPLNSNSGTEFAAAPPADQSNAFDSGNTPSPVQRQPLGNVARDEGLIAALEKQNLQVDGVAINQFNSTDSGSTNPSNEDAPFVSQPIPSSDSSFNQTATDRASGKLGQFNPGVVRADAEPDFASLTYQAAWPQVDKFVAEENFQSALRLLSRYYRSTELTGPQRQRLIGWLDALAGKVIFSAEHHLQSSPYTVANESLADIGQRWKVPAQLIFNINRASIPVVSAISPGTQLKAVEGPFDAEIDLNQKVMTLFLGDLYAGRFPIQVGISGSPRPGEFQVLVKSATGHSWRDSAGNEYAPDAPENGYGPHWIGLSGSLCIHAISDSAQDGHHGCIGLNESDAKDVFAILAEGSTVKIIR